MGVVSSLTPTQIKSLTDFDVLLRGAILAKARLMNLSVAIQEQYNATILPIVSILDSTEVLPTSTGLSGAVPLAQPDPGFLISYLTSLQTFDAQNLQDAGHQALYTKAVGAVNLQGTGA